MLENWPESEGIGINYSLSRTVFGTSAVPASALCVNESATCSFSGRPPSPQYRESSGGLFRRPLSTAHRCVRVQPSALAAATMPLILGPLRFTVVMVVSVTGTIYSTKVEHASDKCEKSNAFGDRLKALMEERGLTQQQVADAAGVSRSAAAKWQHGTIPGARELFNLAKFLDKPMESFFDAIPYVEPTTEALHADPPGGVPVNFLSPEWRTFYAGMFEMMSTPQGTEAFKQAFRQAFEKLSPATAPPQAPGENTSNQVLTDITFQRNMLGMQSEMQNLVTRLERVLSVRGKRAELARFLHVPMPRVSEWLRKKRRKIPSGETTLKLLNWVGQQEGQHKQSPGSASSPPEPKTQSKASNEKKPKSSLPKR